ncbi:MAG: pyruvate kinase, partial [Terriglobia bacterium]
QFGPPRTLNVGETVVLTVGQTNPSTTDQIFVDYGGLASDVRVGHRVLLNEGLIELQVVGVEGDSVSCRVEVGGTLEGGKKVNLPDSLVSAPVFTDKDRSDLAAALEAGVDYVSQSFVKAAADVLAVQSMIPDDSGVKVIAKIEKAWALKGVDEIIEAADGVMVARGDLGAEVPVEDLPLLQKDLIEKCNRVGKPVITATQMLKSMVDDARPTRAESSDVANAILDGTDAIMLSEETAVGRFPVRAVSTMARIAEKAESRARPGTSLDGLGAPAGGSVTEAISRAVCSLAKNLGARAIITPTESGLTPRMVARCRPKVPIVAFSRTQKVVNQLALVWGVSAFLTDASPSIEGMVEDAVSRAVSAGIVSKNETVVITAGVQKDVPGTTNLIKVDQV